MISPISAAPKIAQTALVRFERAAEEVVRTASVDSSSEPSGQIDMAGAITDMMSERLAFSAALVAVKASYQMMDDAIKLGGYNR